MPLDSAMASLSDQLLTIAVFLYAVAMLGYAVEYAFGRRGAVAKAAERPARELAAVGAGGGSTAALDAEPTAETASGGDSDPSGHPISADRAALAGKIAVMLTVLAALSQAGCLVARALAAGRVPWGNMYEFVIAVCLVGVIAWLAVAFRRPVRHLGLFVSLAVVALLGFAAIRLYSEAGPLIPQLNSYWLQIHVTAAIIATGIFLVGFVSAALYLIRARYDAGGELKFPATLGDRLPEAGALERLTFRLHALAFPIWTFAIISGAIWAEEAWTRYWAWDPKETWSFISWVVYAAYLHARATAGWKRTTAAWIAIVGWATMLVNLFVVNLVVEGLHSYSGV